MYVRNTESLKVLMQIGNEIYKDFLRRPNFQLQYVALQQAKTSSAWH